MNDIEIEIQVRIEKRDNLEAFLEKNGDFVGEFWQEDVYYTPAHRDFAGVRPINEWLRLRKSNEEQSITYKHWKKGKYGRTNHCDEFETEVGEGESIKKIFKALDFTELVRVDKERRIWNFQDYEVSLDKVKGLGSFVEIEYRGKGNAVDTQQIAREMLEFLRGVDCGKIEQNHQGYAWQLLAPTETIWEER